MVCWYQKAETGSKRVKLNTEFVYFSQNWGLWAHLLFFFYFLWLSFVYWHYDVILLLMNTTNHNKLKTEPEEVNNTMDRFVLFGPKIWVEKSTELTLARWPWVKSCAMGCKVVPRISTVFDIGAALESGLGHSLLVYVFRDAHGELGEKWGENWSHPIYYSCWYIS